MSGPSGDFGVRYSPDAFAGFFRRFAIVAIDLAVLIALGALLVPIAEALWPDDPATRLKAFFLVCSGIAWAYLTLLEASRIGTLGFRIMGTKIVTLQGEPPSLWKMTFRLLLWVLGPINALIDILWIAGDPWKQTLRDKFAGTYVVRRGAEPIGHAPLRLNRYTLLGYSLVFYEVAEQAKDSSRS
jgi:uncharacterized RDD family membrane protein YckC